MGLGPSWPNTKKLKLALLFSGGLREVDGSVWNRDCVAFLRKKIKPVQMLCVGRVFPARKRRLRDLNWAMENRKSNLQAALCS